MKPINSPTTRIVLPTHQLLQDYQPSSELLSLVELTPTLIVEYYLSQWLRHQQPYLTAPWDDGPVHRRLQVLTLTDLLHSTQFDRLAAFNREGLQKAIAIICDRSYFELIPLIEGLNLNDWQLELLEVGGWLGCDLVLHLPQVDPRRR